MALIEGFLVESFLVDFSNPAGMVGLYPRDSFVSAAPLKAVLQDESHSLFLSPHIY